MERLNESCNQAFTIIEPSLPPFWSSLRFRLAELGLLAGAITFSLGSIPSVEPALAESDDRSLLSFQNHRRSKRGEFRPRHLESIFHSDAFLLNNQSRTRSSRSRPLHPRRSRGHATLKQEENTKQKIPLFLKRKIKSKLLLVEIIHTFTTRWSCF